MKSNSSANALAPLPETPSVTIVTAYYNREDAVEESVESLLQQSYPNARVLLIDDGSTDRTLERLRRFERHPQARVLTGPNQGFTRVMRKSIAEAVDTDLVAIHGSGDLSAPERLAKQVAALRENLDWVMVGCWVNNRLQDDRIVVYHQRSEPVTAEDMLYQNYYTQGEVTFRRDAYLAAGGYRTAFPYAQDRDMWLRLLRFGQGGIVPEFLYERQIRDDGMHANPFRKSFQKALSVAACRCALMRQECGLDVVDLLGDPAVLLLNGDSDAADYVLTRRHLLKGDRKEEAAILEVMAAAIRYGHDPKLFRKYLRSSRHRLALKAIKRAGGSLQRCAQGLARLFPG